MLEKGNHCAYETHYHIVFPVKYRKILLCNRIARDILEIAEEITERYAIEFEKIGCDKNHIHILCSFHPKYSVGSIVRTFKSITAREIFKRRPEIKKELWGGELWSDGYYVGTVGEKGNWQVVENYIKNQGQKLEEVQLRLF